MLRQLSGASSHRRRNCLPNAPQPLAAPPRPCPCARSPRRSRSALPPALLFLVAGVCEPSVLPSVSSSPPAPAWLPHASPARELSVMRPSSSPAPTSPALRLLCPCDAARRQAGDPRFEPSTALVGLTVESTQECQSGSSDLHWGTPHN
uniref:Uncharacterized protein n=1 Tax=Setaria viridis TaxID=4556 RepID=A0A4U6U4Y6_SETVI|nr:hypothetical protein SEVIR_6G183900v2 [Setaria viridis]